jgi:plasmid stabilization system protein ParE
VLGVTSTPSTASINALPLVFRRIAQRELDDSVAWYHYRDARLGVEFKDEIENYLKRISANPVQFPKICGEVRRAVLRRFPYSIHFLLEANRIVILAVFHAQRAPRHLERRY